MEQLPYSTLVPGEVAHGRILVQLYVVILSAPVDYEF